MKPLANDQGASASATRAVSVVASVLPNLALGLHFEDDLVDWSGKGNAVA